jgi:IS66 C-terminal element
MDSPKDSITDDDGLTAVASHLSDAPRHDYDASSAPPQYRAGIFLLGWRAATVYTLIATAKLNGVDPQAWLADVLRRIADHPASRLDESPDDLFKIAR